MFNKTRFKEFLKEYKYTKDDYHNDYFDFSNITSITYGKNVLYENNLIESRSGIKLEENLDEREI